MNQQIYHLALQFSSGPRVFTVLVLLHTPLKFGVTLAAFIIVQQLQAAVCTKKKKKKNSDKPSVCYLFSTKLHTDKVRDYLMNTVEHLSAEEAGISLGSLQRLD